MLWKRPYWWWLGMAVVAYWAISMFAYSMAHPELTQTQVFLSAFEAVTWQW